MNSAAFIRPRTRLPLLAAAMASGLYVIAFLILVFFSRTIFDATFFLGLIGVPLSFVAGALGGALGSLTYVELALLLLFGLLQYSFVGYLVGRCIAFLSRRA